MAFANFRSFDGRRLQLVANFAKGFESESNARAKAQAKNYAKELREKGYYARCDGVLVYAKRK